MSLPPEMWGCIMSFLPKQVRFLLICKVCYGQRRHLGTGWKPMIDPMKEPASTLLLKDFGVADAWFRKSWAKREAAARYVKDLRRSMKWCEHPDERDLKFLMDALATARDDFGFVDFHLFRLFDSMLYWKQWTDVLFTEGFWNRLKTWPRVHTIFDRNLSNLLIVASIVARKPFKHSEYIPMDIEG